VRFLLSPLNVHSPLVQSMNSRRVMVVRRVPDVRFQAER